MCIKEQINKTNKYVRRKKKEEKKISKRREKKN